MLKGSTIGPIVKDFAGEIKKDKLFINKGPVELFLDNNTYTAFEDDFPGLVQDLNLREGKDVIDKLREVMSYDKKRKTVDSMGTSRACGENHSLAVIGEDKNMLWAWGMYKNG